MFEASSTLPDIGQPCEKLCSGTDEEYLREFHVARDCNESLNNCLVLWNEAMLDSCIGSKVYYQCLVLMLVRRSGRGGGQPFATSCSPCGLGLSKASGSHERLFVRPMRLEMINVIVLDNVTTSIRIDRAVKVDVLMSMVCH